MTVSCYSCHKAGDIAKSEPRLKLPYKMVDFAKRSYVVEFIGIRRFVLGFHPFQSHKAKLVSCYFSVTKLCTAKI